MNKFGNCLNMYMIYDLCDYDFMIEEEIIDNNNYDY